MVKEITAEQLERMLGHGDADLVDVRETEEVASGALESSKNWPLSSFGLRQRDISHQRPTIFVCRSGLRSLKAAEIAAEWTDQDVYFLQGGLLGCGEGPLAPEESPARREKAP